MTEVKPASEKPSNLIELREAIENRLQSLCDEYNAHAATVHIYDETQDSLIFPVGVGLRREQRFEWLPSKRGPAAVILRGGQPVFAEDAARHPQFRGPFTFDEGIKSGAGFPQLGSDGTRLNIIFLNYREERIFSDEEQEVLTKAVSQAAAEIHSWMTELWLDIKAEEKWLREHAALQEIARAISAALPETEAVIWLLESERGLVAKAHSELEGISSRVWDAPVEVSSDHYIAEAFRTQKMRSLNVRVDAWPSDEFHHEGANDRRWQTALAVPLGRDGVLTIYTVGYSGLTNKEKAVVSAFAEQARATISAHNRILALEALSRVGNQLNLAFDNPEELLNVIVETAANIMNADEITLHQYDPVRQNFLDLQHSVTYPLEKQKELTPPRVETGASAAVLANGRTSQGVDEIDPVLFDTPHLKDSEVQTFYGIRLDAGNETLGVLFFNYLQPHEFTRDDITVINLFADYAASALRNARLLQNVNARRDELDVLNQVGRELTSRIRLGQAKILESIYRQTAKLMDTRNFYIALFDPDTDVVSFELVYVNGEQVVTGKGAWSPRVGGKGATEAIIYNQKSLLLRTANEARDWYSRPENREYVGDFPERYGYVGVPMMIGERVLGVISVRNLEENNVYDEYDLTALSTIGSQAAIALDNARLYDDVVGRLRALNEIGRELTAGIRLKEDEIVELVHQRTNRLMDMSNSYIALYDEESNQIRFPLATEKGKRIQIESRPFGTGRTEAIITTRKPIFHQTKAEAQEWYAQPAHQEYVGKISASWIGVPMIVGEEVLGVIAAYDDERDHLYRAADLEVLEAIASQAAIALDNATLYYDINQSLEEANQSLEERAEELQSVQDILRSINSERDISALLRRVAQEAHDILEADDAVVYQYDQEFNEFFQQVQLGKREHISPQPGGSSEAAIQHGQIVFADNASSDPIVGKSSFTRERGVQSCVAAPLKVGDEYVGILYVNFYTAPHRFTEDERRIIRIIADQAANAIWTVGRSETANRQLETVLRSIAVAKQREKLPELLQTYLELALNEINTKFGTIQLLDESTGELVIRSQLGEQFRHEYGRISSDQGITGRAFTEKRMVYEPDITKTPHYLGYFEGTKSELAVPLIVNGRPFGVLNAEHVEVNAFDVFTRRLLDLFAAQAAVLINERRLLDAAYEKEKNTQIELRSADMTRMTAHHMKNYLGSAITYLADAIVLVDSPQSAIEKFDRVDANMRRCIAIAHDLFKPYSSEKRAEVDIHVLIKDAISRVDSGDSIDVNIHGFASLPRAWVAPGHAIDYFHEILKNAVRACTESLDIGKITRGVITITGGLNAQGRIELSFANNGPPIPEDQRDKIFEQYSGYSSRSGDTEHYGLGLWGAKTFFQRQDGEVFLRESDENETTFVVVIPSVYPKSGGAN